MYITESLHGEREKEERKDVQRESLHNCSLTQLVQLISTNHAVIGGNLAHRSAVFVTFAIIAQMCKSTFFTCTIASIKLMTSCLGRPCLLPSHHLPLVPVRRPRRWIWKETENFALVNLYITSYILTPDHIAGNNMLKWIFGQVKPDVFVIVVQNVPTITFVPIDYCCHVLKQTLSFIWVGIKKHKRPDWKSSNPFNNSIYFDRFDCFFSSGLQTETTNTDDLLSISFSDGVFHVCRQQFCKIYVPSGMYCFDGISWQEVS